MTNIRDKSVPILSPNTLFHRRYSVVRCLKEGGMGAVYEVLDVRTNTRRALKVMLPEIIVRRDMRQRFAQEARITGAIESEHIVDTVDAGVDEETTTPFLVMELLRGEDLAGVLDKKKTLTPREVVTYLFQTALALDKTHAAGIVHRDLKPENLFLTRRDDGSPCVKVLDFGIAKVIAQSGRGRTTRSIGTPLYMAPEQMGGKGVITPRTDVYALGHIAFTLLAGEAYWDKEWQESETALAFVTEVARGLPEPASARALGYGVVLPSAFDEWFLTATAARREERFETAMETVELLADALSVPLPKPSEADLDPAMDAPSATEASGDSMAFKSTMLAIDPTEDPTAPMTPAAPAVVGPTAPLSSNTSAPLTRETKAVASPRATRAIVVVGVLVGVVAVAVVVLRWSSAQPRSSDDTAQTAPTQVTHAAPAPSAAAAPAVTPVDARLTPAPPSALSASPTPPPASARVTTLAGAQERPPTTLAGAQERPPTSPRAPPPSPSVPPAALSAKPPARGQPKAPDSCYKGGVFQSNDPSCTEQPR